MKKDVKGQRPVTRLHPAGQDTKGQGPVVRLLPAGKKAKSQRLAAGLPTGKDALARLLLGSCILLSACASTSSRERILRDMALGAGVGFLFAQTKEKNQEAYSVVYSSIGAASGAAISLYREEPKEDQLKKENEELIKKISEFQKRLEPKLVKKGDSLYRDGLPAELTGFVDPGEWKRYKMDEWVEDPNSPGTWYRRIEMLELTPPVTR